MSAYTNHLKDYAAKNAMTYKQAMSDAGAKAAYAKIKADLPPKQKKPRVKKVKTEPVKEPVEEPVEETKPKKVVRRKATPKAPKEPEQEEIFQSD